MCFCRVRGLALRIAAVAVAFSDEDSFEKFDEWVAVEARLSCTRIGTELRAPFGRGCSLLTKSMSDSFCLEPRRDVDVSSSFSSSSMTSWPGTGPRGVKRRVGCVTTTGAGPLTAADFSDGTDVDFCRAFRLRTCTASSHQRRERASLDPLAQLTSGFRSRSGVKETFIVLPLCISCSKLSSMLGWEDRVR